MTTTMRLCLLACLSLALDGCGSVVVFGHTVRAAPPATAPVPANAPVTAVAPMPPVTPTPSASTAHKVSAVALEFAPLAQEKIRADVGFSKQALLDTLHQTLRARGVLGPEAVAPTTAPTSTAVVSVVDFETHASSNATVFGYRLGAGTLTAEIVVHGSAGAEAQRFKVVASAQLRAAAASSIEGSFPLEPLYRSLAERVADDLAGTPGKADEAVQKEVPR